MESILVVGAGFAGSVVARELAENGFKIDVIERRSHIGGNAYDEVNAHRERIHMYGPHLLHGNRESVAIKWLSRFTEWTYYEHRVRALLSTGKTTPLPVNRTTLEEVFNITLNDEASTKEFLESQILKITPRNTDEVFLANVGPHLADIFFRPYTRKMWGVDAKDLEANIGARLPVKLGRDDRYFSDSFQALPTDGYSALFSRILDHENITLSLNTAWATEYSKDYEHTFLSMPIDEYFEYSLGRLPYRSLKFTNEEAVKNQDAPVINFTDEDVYTRSTQWDLLPNSGKRSDGFHTITKEFPCDAMDNNNECYYPVRNRKSVGLYDSYCKMVDPSSRFTLIGRAGLFKYIDMVPCVAMHLSIANKYITKRLGQP